MEIHQGDLFWVDLGVPRDSEPGYHHPHVVIQNNLFNQSKINTVVVCALTSNLKRAKAPGERPPSKRRRQSEKRQRGQHLTSDHCQQIRSCRKK